ncbi:MAG: tRNA (adenosine(37)-N6)-threonylcarbamoyltransferase complex dimerization subunit type 1 TsaB [Mycoplasmataceae bacterium]|jgi:tRNA threonylcarbamoyl adenosine modification protein YeaZ|nr:tRNA (adenosine(37)-N6)-threonylcarbamoyltransferase complex dimerization subunit type 1 TsaB [Mycoplasmataceae bacterium]
MNYFIKKYFTFDKKFFLNKIIPCLCAFFLVISVSLIISVIVQNDAIYATLDKNSDSFIHIKREINQGVAFSMLDSSPIFASVIQFISSLIFLFLIFFVIKNPVCCFFLAAVSFGGFFNFFDRFALKTIDGIKTTGVLDYLQFSFWQPVFNIPDMCVVGGSICFIISFIIVFIIDASSYTQIDKKKEINLFIDTCFENLNIGVFQEDFFNIKICVPTHNNLTDISIDYIKNMLEKISVNIKQINNIYLTIGPGSFTGCRIGCIFAKVLKTINPDLKIYTVDSLRLQKNNNSLSIIDAKGKKFYTALYINNELKQPIGIKTMDEISSIAKELNIPIYKNYENVDIFANFFLNKSDFSLTNLPFDPLYIKNPI